jgi:hypothetical protein
MNAQVTWPGRSPLSGARHRDVYRLLTARADDLGLRGKLAGRRLPVGGGDERGEPFGGGAAHARQQVLIGVHGERGVGVPELFGFPSIVGLQHRRCGCGPEPVLAGVTRSWRTAAGVLPAERWGTPCMRRRPLLLEGAQRTRTLSCVCPRRPAPTTDPTSLWPGFRCGRRLQVGTTT